MYVRENEQNFQKVFSSKLWNPILFRNLKLFESHKMDIKYAIHIVVKGFF